MRMPEAEYQAGLAALRAEWGELAPDPQQPGILRAANDPLTGLIVGLRAPIFAEAINRALALEPEVSEALGRCADIGYEGADQDDLGLTAAIARVRETRGAHEQALRAKRSAENAEREARRGAEFAQQELTDLIELTIAGGA